MELFICLYGKRGISYTFTVKAISAAGTSESSTASHSVIPTLPQQPGSHNNDNAPARPDTTDNGMDILVNGKVENAGAATMSKRQEQSVIMETVDQIKLDDKLEAEGQYAVVTIPVNQHSDIVIAELNGQMVKNLESKQAVLEIKTDKATYTLPAQQLNIDAISKLIGESVDLQSIKLQIEIAASPTDTVKVVENAAAESEFILVMPSLDFSIRAEYGDTNVEVFKFNAYVERMVVIPDGVDPNKITAGVVVDPDGTVRHVPTKVVRIDGQYYAQINSLTNSTYSVVWNPLEFNDVSSHWAKQAVNNMGSRMVVEGIGNGIFNPDQDMTRAEFAAILVRGLGLKPESGESLFLDVKGLDWYSGVIKTAYEYQLIHGFEDGTFRPNEKITREQAAVIISRAISITGLRVKIPTHEVNITLNPYTDAKHISNWAISSFADNVGARIVTGKPGNLLAPKAFITRAEVAVMVQRLLEKSELI